ncbi:hypothetical protein ADUPG1_007853 [Aduncisulcus paluster]|uniref:Uncharacterized protein n=1 Tax=Aduncisulcus paluster TaxID=2918883 RepID=A0ABQ5KPW1_9EUKA|nr:hypothetical protein ADUPG1_007853 [Aduncisulcus paluster]|eukprot:gnl/Carplike_NY0171/4783_a6516_381.p1 GENE.gnl/Carplike_NY0171/4783_a6516_381~~gnl/Carplike_NY0171/4783_a6516_381.p1  ORF type:complete len:378 (+),score=59.37 gnl/Carplike_NY0171/4783_a6516_381:42-1175(+)
MGGCQSAPIEESVRSLERVHGFSRKPPLSREDPAILKISIEEATGSDEQHPPESPSFDVSASVRKMLGGVGTATASNISLPFCSVCNIKGVYVSVEDSYDPQYEVTFTHSDKSTSVRRYCSDSSMRRGEWYFLSVSADDVIHCTIRKNYPDGTIVNSPGFRGLFFVRNETPAELKEKEERKTIETGKGIRAVYVREGDRSSPPVPSGDPSIIRIDRGKICGRDESEGTGSVYYDRSELAREMVKGVQDVPFSHLTLPFVSSTHLEGVYVCIDQLAGPPHLLLTFINTKGVKIFKKYMFLQPTDFLEWFYMPVDLDDIVSCTIEGWEIWEDRVREREESQRRNSFETSMLLKSDVRVLEKSGYSWLEGIIFVKASPPP